MLEQSRKPQDYFRVVDIMGDIIDESEGKESEAEVR